MRVYTCKFNGHWPVGACAVVFAENQEQAQRLLAAELAKENLTLNDSDDWDSWCDAADYVSAEAHILLNGEY